MLIVSIYLSNQFLSGIKLENNIIRLLPASDQQQSVQQAINTISNNVGQKIVFLIANKDKYKASNSAKTFHESLLDSKLFTHITYTIDSDSLKSIYQLYSPYKNMLLSKQHRDLLSENKYKDFSQQALHKIYNPTTAINSAQLENDPFFSLVDFLQQQNTLSNNLTLDNGQLITQYNNQYYVFISADINDSIYSLDAQNRFNHFYKQTKQYIADSNQNTHILSMGAIHYAIEGSTSAKHEISTIGIGSLVGIVVLILFVFRSLAPLLLSIISISSGIIVGLSSSLYFFGEVHLFTLVFGASLIGVSIDYSFHYFSERLSGEDNNSTITHILPGISMGMFSSALAYLALSISDFPGLQQISLFSMSGLIASYCCVVLFYPAINFKNKPSTLIISINKPVITWWKKINITKLKLFIIISLTGLSSMVYFNLQFDDDIRNLRNQSSHVANEETVVKNVIQVSGENQFYLIQAESPELVLQKEEELLKSLDKLISKKALRAYQSTALFSPSEKRQLENFNLLKKAINSENLSLRKYLQSIGYPEKNIQSYTTQFDNQPTETLSVTSWLSSKASSSMKFHWLGKSETGNTYLSIISLYGIRDLNALQEVPLPDGAKFIDYVEDISRILKQYREQASYLIVFAYIMIFVMLCVRYGWYKAIFVFTPPLLAALSALSIALSMGIKINYFNSLAVVLILGISIDYSLFYAEQKNRAEFTMLGVLLSAITTILAFGLLALSNTPALHSFGVIVLSGICVAFLLSPMAGMNVKKQQIEL